MAAPQPFDAAQDLADAPRRPGVAQRPKDAATLILVRGQGSGAAVLMGRRAPGHVFMGAKWVFPGGRIDRSDFTAASATDLADDAAIRLNRELPPHRARALALAAVRETFEETGLMLARPAAPRAVAGPWRDFRAAGALPDLEALSYVARAITPPGRVRRFDARFFMADADRLLNPDAAAVSRELDEIAWLTLVEARGQDLPAITRYILDEVAERLDSPRRPLPLVRMVRGRHVVEHRE
ncbi:NUDIX hydrolase [Brevundimonas sp. Leaf363]|uniref:NUDIX hydrolase n=1 Tax=Brevundimonas sp. Leaf363 TaxID=1736353 RepID=UPI0006F2BFD8|nr:NUDIX domain-containing protein [Brevundimonas sp. Leaf363]KQS55812.1 NUDIX hydrolase [Brevundimonas sp. Leaf363]